MRPKKATTGTPLAAAIRERYTHVSAPSDAHVVLHDAQHNAVHVEVVNGEKVERRLQNLHALLEAVLSGMDVREPQPGETAVERERGKGVRDMCPELRALDLSTTLLAAWPAVAEMVREAPALRSLILK